MVEPKADKLGSRATCYLQPEKRQLDAPWITGTVQTPAGEIPAVDTILHFSDKFRSFLASCAIGRSKYRVKSGLYAVGHPTDDSPVFVSANYKMSFDRLRSNLAGIDSWILVLDTKGVNVWCAAGKGTFGTEEIVNRIRRVNLEEVVSHRRLILPQLGAPGVSAHQVKKLSGFGIIYGSIGAQDLPAFMNNNMKATPEMRGVSFSFRDRIVLIPAELVLSAKYAFLVAALFLFLSGFGPGIYSFNRVVTYGIPSAGVILLAYISGTILPPVLLPWLPGRAFSLKGAWVGLVVVPGVGWYGLNHSEVFRGTHDILAWLFIIPAVTSFIAMNFTGCSTFTSLSGVRKEMRIAMPIQISIAFIGLVLWVLGLFV